MIRQAGLEDAAAISEIGLDSFRTAYEGTCGPDDLILHLDEFHAEAAVTRQMNSPANNYLIAEHDSQPAGFAKVRDSSPLPETSATKVIELHQLYVSPKQQRFGIGGQLVDALVSFAREEAAQGIWLSAWEDASWAVNFYLKQGFATVGTTEFRLGRTVYTDLLMWRRVDSGN